jgi:hypothetical protein
MKLLFGSIIVKGAGRINGHVVRNFRGMPLLTRLALPTRTNAFNANPQLNVSTAAFKYWATLDIEKRNDWSNIAAEIPFTDRWGNTKYLSGRDFVSYLYINLTNLGTNMIQPNEFISTFPSFTCEGVEINVKDGEFITTEFKGEDTLYQLIYLKQGINQIRNYSAKELKFILSASLEYLPPNDVYNQIINQGIVFETGQTWSIGIKAISSSGLASPMQIFKFTIVD